jgi:hypothetical protein
MVTAERTLQTRWHFARTGFGLFLLLAVAGSPGCFFDTREPEEVEDGGEACYEAVVAERAELVFQNLDGSLSCFQTGTYMDELTEDFRYIPPPSVAAGAPDPWTKQTERLFVDRLFADADSVESYLVNREIQTSGTDPLEIEAEYRVRVVIDGSATEYVGEAFYRLRQEGSRWKMFEWEEKDSDLPLGQLKVGLAGSG